MTVMETQSTDTAGARRLTTAKAMVEGVAQEMEHDPSHFQSGMRTEFTVE